MIPISLLGAQNAKVKHPANVSPPKLQRIPKPDGADVQTRSPSRIAKAPSATSNSSSNVDKKESGWFPQTENEFLQSHDGTMPKPAQNIAFMGGKRYIVVPKNNAMAVQPAITVKPDKIGDKPPMLQDGSLIDISNIVDNSVAKLCTPTPKHSNTDVSETVDVTPDKEILKDATPLTDLASPAAIDEVTEVFENKEAAKTQDKLTENVSENESSTVSMDVSVPESTKIHEDHKSPENKSVTPVYTESASNTLETCTEETYTEEIKTDCQLLSSKASTVKVKNK